MQVIVCGAGAAAHLAGVCAATELPVLGKPLACERSAGARRALATAQMPAGVPVGTLAIGKAGARNAGPSPRASLARTDAVVAERVRAQRRKMAEEVAAKDAAPQAKLASQKGWPLAAPAPVPREEIPLLFAAGLLFLTQILLATCSCWRRRTLFGSGVPLVDVGAVVRTSSCRTSSRTCCRSRSCSAPCSGGASRRIARWSRSARPGSPAFLLPPPIGAAVAAAWPVRSSRGCFPRTTWRARSNEDLAEQR